MNELNQDNMPISDGDDIHGQETTKTLAMISGMGDELPGVDFTIGSTRKLGGFFNQSTMLVMLLFVVAAGAIYTMRAMQSDLSSGGVASDLELKVEQALARVLDSSSMAENDPLRRDQMDNLFKDTDSVLDMFAADPKQRQVPPEYVKKNPFVLPIFKSIAEPVADVPDVDQRKQELARESSKYTVQSIMRGKTPVAIIDGELYKVGQSLGSFTIRAISELTVTIEADGHRFDLSMASEDDGKFKSPFGR